MSSTNRSDSRDLHIADYYVTPINKIEDFLKEFIKYEKSAESRILDPCAGGDKDHPMSYPNAIQNVLHIKADTLDIREDSLAEIKGDYLNLNTKDKYNIIITNPPFNIARDIIEKALDDVKENGFVIMLLRLNFLGGKLRQDLWKKQLPKYIFVHNRRMSFTDNGKTDSIEYAHFAWQKGCYPDFSQLKVIYDFEVGE